MNNKNLTYLTISAILLSGCAVAPNATLKQRELTGHDILATDSRLRVIAETEQTMFAVPGQVDPKRILCTEPSPDIATTLANSLGVGINVLNYGSASLSTAQVEGLVQLGERTAAIQLLRDKMYQTCLAYANGAISSTNYTLIMSRLDDAIITMSLGDNAAGAFGRKLAGIGGEANAQADTSFNLLPAELGKLEDNSIKLAAANKKVDTAETALQEHLANPETDDDKKKEYDQKTGTLKETLKTAQDNRDALLELMRSSANSASQAVAKISKLETGGSITGNQNAAEIMPELQANFLDSVDISKDVINTCLVELGKKIPSPGEPNYSANLSQAPELAAYQLVASRSSPLRAFCETNLLNLYNKSFDDINKTREKQLDFREKTATAKYAADVQLAEARKLEAFIKSMEKCEKLPDEEKSACKKIIGLIEPKK